MAYPRGFFSLSTLIILVLLLVAGAALWYQLSREKDVEASVSSFEECVAAGNPVMESYPRKCIANKVTYVEEVADVIIQSSNDSMVWYSAAAEVTEAREDCQVRGGTLNECGSACEAGVDVCIDVCALVCELETKGEAVNINALQ